jgi:hypothetical protein
VKKYTDFSELTPSMLNEFIQKITVHEAEKINGRVRKQKVEIYLSFIGQFTFPNQTENPEPDPCDPAEAKRAKWREYYYKDREKILAKKAEERARAKAGKHTVTPIKSPEEIAAEKEAKREKKREYLREYNRKWRDENREKVREISKKHRDKKRAGKEIKTA